MPLISNTELKTVDLGNDEWVKIPSTISYIEFIEFISQKDATQKDKVQQILQNSIKEWNIRDGDDVAEITPENIARLDYHSGEKVVAAFNELIGLSKKK